MARGGQDGDADRVTIYHVAERCGVSIATVSKAFSHKPGARDISAATRDRVLAAAEALGYEPDWGKRRNAARRSGHIGLVSVRSRPFIGGVYGRILEQLGLSAASRGWRLVTLPVLEGEDWRRVAGRFRLDGCVFTTPLPGPGTDFTGGVPAVAVNERSELPMPHLFFDDAAGARLATEHLLAGGARRVAYLEATFANAHHSVRDRYEGHRAAMDAAGRGTWTIDAGQDLSALLGAADAPDALVAYDHRRAWDVLQALSGRQSGSDRWPRVVACDDSRLPVHPALAGIRLPAERLCRQALDLLDDLMAGRRRPGHEAIAFTGEIDPHDVPRPE